MAATTLTVSTRTNVGMGQVAIARSPETLTTVLGSCIGVAIYHPQAGVGALAHVVLPDSGGRKGHPGKFADTAIPYMIQRIRDEGVFKNSLIAKLAGGASMFGSRGLMEIGECNLNAVKGALELAGIQIVAQHVGGQKGRRATFDCGNGDMKIEIAGKPHEIL